MKRRNPFGARLRKHESLPGLKLLEAETSDDLIEIAQDASRSLEDRATACSLLGQMRSRQSAGVLLRLGLDAKENLLIWEAFAAVGAVGSRAATRPLLRLIRTTDSVFKRQAAVFALGFLHDERARPMLTKILLDAKENARTRGLAAEGLGLLRARPGTLQALVELLRDASAEVRYSALCSLGALRGKTAVGPIRNLLGDPTIADGSMSVADRAAEVLAGIRG
jgi:HEAT repeat protein